MIVSTILTILKIIGIILLSVIFFLLLALLLTLFVPVFYKAYVNFDNTLSLKAKVRIFFGIISVNVNICESKDVYIKLFGVRFKHIDIDKEEIEYSDEASKLIQEEKIYKMSIELNETNEKNSEKEKKSIFIRLKYKITDFIKKIKKIIKDTKDWITFIKSLSEDHLIKDALNYSKKHFFKIVKQIGPRKSDLVLNFGFDDPSQTGYVLAVASPFYGLYGRWLTVQPDFTEKVIKLRGNVKGHIFPYILIWHFLRVYFNKNVKAILKKIKRRGVNNGKE